MQDICDEVVKRLEGERERERVDVDIRFKGVSTSVYDNDFFYHNVSLSLLPSALGGSFNISFHGVEFSAHPEVLRSVADSVAEEIRGAALASGIHNAFMETALTARAGEAVILRTATGHNMRNTADSVLSDVKRVKVLAENFVRVSSYARTAPSTTRVQGVHST